MEKDKEYGDKEYPVYKDKVDKEYPAYKDTEYPAYKNKEYKNEEYPAYKNKVDEEYPAYKDKVDEEYPAYKDKVDEEYPVYKNKVDLEFPAYKNKEYEDEEYPAYKDKVDLEYPAYKNKEYEDEEYPAYKDKVERDSEDWKRPTQEFNAVTEHSADWNRIKEKHKDDWSSVKNNPTDEWSKKDEPAEFYNKGDDWSSVKNGHKKDWSAVKTNYEQDWPSAKKYLDEVKPLETEMEENDWLPVQKEKENWRDQDRDQSSPDSQSRDELESPNLPYVQGALKIQLTDRGYNNGMENSTGGFGGYNNGMEKSNKEFGEKVLFAPRTFANEGSEGENTAPSSVNYFKDTESSDDERHESSEDEDEGRGEVVGSLSFKIPTREYTPRETFKEKLNAEDDKDVDETDLTHPDQFMNMINKPVYSVQGVLGKNEEEDENSSSDEERNESPNYMVEKPGDGIWKMVEHDSEIEKKKTELRNGGHEEKPTELEIRTETKTSNFLESESEIKEGLDDFYNSGNVVSGFLDSALSSLQINGLCKTKVNLFFNNLQKVSTVLDITDHLSI